VSGTLFVIATPLGNLDDLSPRSLDTLRRVSAIACEDTRRTARLLARHSIQVPTFPCHRFNEGHVLEPILDRLRSGEDVGLVSDGGTPGVSDPGTLLVRAALDEEIRVCPVAGPSAVAAILSVSGLPGDRFVFEGFLAHRAGERRRRLRELRGETRTVVAFETPHRILGALADLAEVFGDRPIVLGRELTKVHESVLRGTAAELAESLGDSVRGEIALAIAGARDDETTQGLDGEAKRILDCWDRSLEQAEGNRRDALRQAARELGMKRPELQRRLAELRPER
jgi:16S rRNA (cytidine1402-2'-O)-methyltransferase